MGRPRRLSAATKIANAEELFRQSVAEGKPDYGYVALAIGDRPFDPLAWAVLECIELRGDTSRGAMRGHDGPASITTAVPFPELLLPLADCHMFKIRARMPGS